MNDLVEVQEKELDFVKRKAEMLLASGVLPRHLTHTGVGGNQREKPKSEQLGLACILIDLSMRTRQSVASLGQSAYFVHNTLAFPSKYAIGMFNLTKEFYPLQYKQVGQEGTDSYGSVAYARHRATGDSYEGPPVTIGMAKKEGWYGKKGSKWPSMTETMLRYRAAMFFIRTTSPECMLGISTVEEVEDTAYNQGVHNVTSEPVKEAQEQQSEGMDAILKIGEQNAQEMEIVTPRNEPEREPEPVEVVEAEIVEPEAPQSQPVSEGNADTALGHDHSLDWSIFSGGIADIEAPQPKTLKEMEELAKACENPNDFYETYKGKIHTGRKPNQQKIYDILIAKK